MIDLKGMKDADITTIDPATLVDINEIKLRADSKEERIQEYIKKVKNPYCFLCDGYVVKLGFSDTKVTMTERLCNYISRIATSEVNG